MTLLNNIKEYVEQMSPYPQSEKPWGEIVYIKRITSQNDIMIFHQVAWSKFCIQAPLVIHWITLSRTKVILLLAIKDDDLRTYTDTVMKFIRSGKQSYVKTFEERS